MSRRLRDGFREHGFHDEHCALHDERQHDAVANLAPTCLRLRLLARCGREAVDGVLDRRQDFGEECCGDALLDVFGDVLHINRVNDVVPNFCPFAHDNTHPSILKT